MWVICTNKQPVLDCLMLDILGSFGTYYQMKYAFNLSHPVPGRGFAMGCYVVYDGPLVKRVADLTV